MKPRAVVIVVAAGAILALAVSLMFAVQDQRPHPGSTGAAAPGPSPRPAPSEASPPQLIPAAPVGAKPIPAPSPIRDADGHIVVRDHRDETEPSGPPSPIASVTLAEARQILGPMIRACIPFLPDKKLHRMVVHARFKVSGGRVTASDVSVSDAEELGAGYVGCVQQAYGQLSTDPSADQKDGEDLVHMPWTVP
jgi:hypothetical protein